MWQGDGGGGRVIDGSSSGGCRVVDTGGCAGMVVHVIAVAVFVFIFVVVVLVFVTLSTLVVLVVSSAHWVAGWLVGRVHVMDAVGRDGGGGRVVVVALGVTPVRSCKGVMSNGGYIIYEVCHVVAVVIIIVQVQVQVRVMSSSSCGCWCWSWSWSWGGCLCHRCHRWVLVLEPSWSWSGDWWRLGVVVRHVSVGELSVWWRWHCQ